MTEVVVGTRRPWVSYVPDALIAVALGVVAFLLRRHGQPRDGLFYDDAWQAFAATKGSLATLFTAGQTQPGFTSVLMVWHRLFGGDADRLMTPALIAGILGPPALYLVLRYFGYARSIATLMGAILTVTTTHILFSHRVKSYTADLLVVLLLTVTVAQLAGRKWRPSTAVGWTIGSLIISTFSPFALVASSAAGVIFLLQSRGDRRVRAWAVAAQAVGTVVYLGAVSRTYNDRPLRGFWFKQGAFIDFGRNPLRLPAETVEHLRRITEVFPGGGSRWAGIVLLVAIVGLVVASVRGPQAVLARFCVAIAVLAFGGALIRRFPFGPRVNASTTGRVSLWLVPVVAVGLAVVLTYVRQATATGSRRRFGFDALLFACAAFIMVNAIGDNSQPVHAAACGVAERVMTEVGPHDAVWTTWPATYSLALYADTPVRLHGDPEREVGFVPEFVDRRLHGIERDTSERDFDAFADSVERVFVVQTREREPAAIDPYEVIAAKLSARGFRHERTTVVDTGQIDVWRRTGS